MTEATDTDRTAVAQGLHCLATLAMTVASTMPTGSLAFISCDLLNTMRLMIAAGDMNADPAVLAKAPSNEFRSRKHKVATC